ncbi:MAG: hypothetical protein PHO76_02580 [Methylotenera sp.]|nr:hypothetical protein [Methylotenera sp.]MDD4927229.1 hypothetical protein [Methylotenera sp.]
MGSYSSSYNASSTQYTNAPITQSDVTNPVNLTNASNIKLGTNESVLTLGTNSQYTLNALDGDAISKAFDFGSNLVGIVADLTKQSNAAAQAQSGAALQGVIAAKEAATAQTAAVDLTQNKTLIYAAVAMAVAYMYLNKGR